MIAPLGGNRGLVEEWRRVYRSDAAVLAVVLATRGSTYRKRGALVLLDRNGVRFGALSGGCLEPELERRARDVIASGRAAPATFDTADPADRLLGSGVGCQGSVDALLLPIAPSSNAHLLAAVERAQDEGRSLHVILRLDLEALGSGAAWTEGWRVRWDASGNEAADGREAAVDSPESFVLPPPPRLLLLGAGPETPPLISFARRLGWYVWVVDHRERWAGLARAAGADGVEALRPEEAVERFGAERIDALVVMSHSFETDLEHLKAWADTAGFIGLVGPVARRDALLALAGERAAALEGKIHGPIGLPLGGDGPESIALSIAAQLQRHFSGGRGD